MKLEIEEYASLGDGKLMKTLAIHLIPEDEEDERIIRDTHISKLGDMIYL